MENSFFTAEKTKKQAKCASLPRSEPRPPPTPRARHATSAPPSGWQRARAPPPKEGPRSLPRGRSLAGGSRERSSASAEEQQRQALPRGRSRSRPRTGGLWPESPSPTARCRIRGMTRSTTSCGPTFCTSRGTRSRVFFLFCCSPESLHREHRASRQSISLPSSCFPFVSLSFYTRLLSVSFSRV